MEYLEQIFKIKAAECKKGVKVPGKYYHFLCDTLVDKGDGELVRRPSHISIPVPADTPVAEFVPSLVGKTITVTVSE